MFRTTNPALNDNIFGNTRTYGVSAPMTIQGTVNKSLILLLLVVISASWVWGMAAQPQPMFYDVTQAQPQAPAVPAAVSGLMMLGIFGGLIMAMVTIFKKEWAGVTAPVYALLEGLALGGISAFFEMSFPGIVIQAVGLTFGTLFCLLLAYKTGFVTVTDKFRMGVFAATGGICLLYIVNLVMGFFGASIPLIHSSGGFGIAFSLFVVGVAALNLVLDFDFIDRAARAGAPKHMEWFGAFGLMVTLIWLYIEILHLLSKLNSRR